MSAEMRLHERASYQLASELGTLKSFEHLNSTSLRRKKPLRPSSRSRAHRRTARSCLQPHCSSSSRHSRQQPRAGSWVILTVWAGEDRHIDGIPRDDFPVADDQARLLGQNWRGWQHTRREEGRSLVGVDRVVTAGLERAIAKSTRCVGRGRIRMILRGGTA